MVAGDHLTELLCRELERVGSTTLDESNLGSREPVTPVAGLVIRRFFGLVRGLMRSLQVVRSRYLGPHLFRRLWRQGREAHEISRVVDKDAGAEYAEQSR